MERYLFRGKQKKTNKWIYGCLVNNALMAFDSFDSKECMVSILDSDLGDKDTDIPGLLVIGEVDPKTLGMFTGLHDSTKWEDLTEQERELWVRNGNMPSDWKGRKIFEGDIATTDYGNGEMGTDVGDIQFDCGVFGIEWCHAKKTKSMVGSWGNRHNLRTLEDDIIDRVKVIGNIHDNPELLK